MIEIKLNREQFINAMESYEEKEEKEIHNAIYTLLSNDNYLQEVLKTLGDVYNAYYVENSKDFFNEEGEPYYDDSYIAISNNRIVAIDLNNF